MHDPIYNYIISKQNRETITWCVYVCVYHENYSMVQFQKTETGIWIIYMI